MPETMTLTNRELWRMYAALKLLGNRRMANVGADLKVGRMLRVLAPLAEPLESAKQHAVQDVIKAAPPDATGLALSRVNLAGAAAQLAVDEATVEVALPLAFALREADLPKEQSGEEGWRNAAGLGALMTDLGPLFILPD